jgi:hypothetical protein
MIAPQSPSLQVFVTIERVLRADMASEHFSSIYSHNPSTRHNHGARIAAPIQQV